MGKEELEGYMSMRDAISFMSEGNPGALTLLIRMLKNPRCELDIILLDSLNIRGSKIWMLYSDCCDQNMKKFNRTLMALRSGAYTQEEIQSNFGLCHALPFLDDTVQIEGVPSYEQEFGPADEKWSEYIKANREVVVPKINEKINANNSNKR